MCIRDRPNTRWSYVNAWEPKSINGGTPKYSVSLIIPKSDTGPPARQTVSISASSLTASLSTLTQFWRHIPTGAIVLCCRQPRVRAKSTNRARSSRKTRSPKPALSALSVAPIALQAQSKPFSLMCMLHLLWKDDTTTFVAKAALAWCFTIDVYKRQEQDRLFHPW